ncbi:sensor histidine kinase [Bacteroidota bacterium]
MKQKQKKSNSLWSVIRKLYNSSSSIYGQVLKVVGLLSLFLVLSFGIIFRTVNKEYMEDTIHQNGNNVVMLVEGALYEHMLENNKTALTNTLGIINRMPGIEDVNMYDANNNLAYSSFRDESTTYHNPNCIECHANINTMFSSTEQSYKIINLDNECEMSEKEFDYRLLMIKSPILNEPSCYTNACHAHNETEQVLGSLVIRIPLAELDANLEKTLILALFTSLILVSLILFYAYRRIKKPMMQITNASEAVAGGDKDTRLEISPRQLNDVRMVSLAFNKMLDNLQAANTELQNWSNQLEYKVQKKSEEISEMQNELMHIERIASLGKLSSSVAHEINNPLSGVLTYTKLVHKHIRRIDLEPDEKKTLSKYLNVIENETKRCGDIVKGLLDFSRTDKQDFKPNHMHKLLKETYTLIEHQMKIESIVFQTEFSAGSDQILCSGNQIKQACIAILLNALEAVLDNGIIKIKTFNPDDDHIHLEISDNGVGITQEDVPHVFEPFFTTKEKASGIGLGLAIVHGIVQNHDGKIELDSVRGKGTTISIVLPLINPQN